MAEKTDVKKTVRDTEELNVLVKVMLDWALKKIEKKKINPLIVETYRPLERQYYLYGQGRSVSNCVGAGMPKKYAKKYARNGSKVTWTLDSIHIKRCAVDLIPQRKNSKGVMEAVWNSNDKETKQIISIMEKAGFEAGANWSNSPDSPHYQVAGVSSIGKYFKKSNTNMYVTKMIQRQLKSAGFYKDYEIDGKWGKATDNAIKKWKKSLGWKVNKKIGAVALKKLLKY